MSDPLQIDHARQRRIYEYVERNGVVAPETVRKNVLVRPETDSKPARSGADLEPSVSMSADEFERHVSALEDEGYLTERNGKLRVAVPLDDDATTVDVGDETATVRPARQEDMAGIVDVVERVATEEGYVVAERLAEEVTRDDVLLRYNESEDRVFFVATADEGPVGWLHVGGVRAPRMDHTATLTLGVDARYRDHGLGAALMDRGLAWAREQAYRKVYQNLPATNEGAISFLEAHGWTVESTREGHYQLDDDLIDEVQLAVWLDD